jgi:serum/glucocorticoid-regulated kinase 2
MGNTAIVQLLIAYGADVNIGYHDLNQPLPGRRRREPKWYKALSCPCGRVVQLAMELRFDDIVEFLLDAGAYINLKHPVWQYHECKPRSREVYLRITAGLRTAASRRLGIASSKSEGSDKRSEVEGQ